MMQEPADNEPSVFNFLKLVKAVCNRNRVCNLKCMHVFHFCESNKWKQISSDCANNNYITCSSLFITLSITDCPHPDVPKTGGWGEEI